MGDVKGKEILTQTKAQCQRYRQDFVGKAIKIIYFEPGADENANKLPQYKAAQYSTQSKIKTFQFLGCEVESVCLEQKTTLFEFQSLLKDYDSNPNVMGIIVQNPMPLGLKDSLALISFKKDLDGMQPGNPYFPTPATSETIFRLVQSFAQPTDIVAVVGAKGFFGGGVVQCLQKEGFEVMALDAGDNLLRTRLADIVVAATGVPDLLDERHIVTNHKLVVDAGFIPLPDGKILGDVSRSAYEIPAYITPVPGGVGPFQMATLLERLVAVVSKQAVERWVYPLPEQDFEKTTG